MGTGTRKNYVSSIERLEDRARTLARQGDFFFAKWVLSTGGTRSAPVLIIGVDADPEDVVVCACTGSPARTSFDIEVALKMKTFVRTNKVYTIGRAQLRFPIPQKATPIEFARIMQSIRRVFGI